MPKGKGKGQRKTQNNTVEEVMVAAAAEAKVNAEAEAAAKVQTKVDEELMRAFYELYVNNEDEGNKNAWKQDTVADARHLETLSSQNLSDILDAILNNKDLAKDIFKNYRIIVQIHEAFLKKKEADAAAEAKAEADAAAEAKAAEAEAAKAAEWAIAFETIVHKDVPTASPTDVRPAIQDPLFETPRATTRRSGGVSKSIQINTEVPEVYGLNPGELDDLIECGNDMLADQNKYNAQRSITSKGEEKEKEKEKEKDKAGKAILASLNVLKAGYKNQGEFRCIFTKEPGSYSPYFLWQQGFYTGFMLPKHLASVGLELEVDSLNVICHPDNKLEVSGYIKYK